MNRSENYNKLKKYGKKTITKTQLEKLFGYTDEETLFSIISELQKAQILEPMRNSKTNGNMVYPIYLKYKINFAEETFDGELAEISALHPHLQYGGVLQNKPSEYRKYREALRKLDHYLFTHSSDCIPVSRKERSFEIFNEEKFLDDKTFCKLLEKLNLNPETLFFYDTPEYCFNDFIPEKKTEMTLLICENKDIWFNIRRRMFEDHASEILGTHIDGVVFGSGNEVSQKNALTSYTRFLGDTKVSYLYWGDIDRAGLNIFLSLLKNNPDLDIRLFVPAYEEMLRFAPDFNIPDSDDKREIIGDYSGIYSVISNGYKEQLQESILQNKRIPQEIITYANLLDIMR